MLTTASGLIGGVVLADGLTAAGLIGFSDLELFTIALGFIGLLF